MLVALVAGDEAAVFVALVAGDEAAVFVALAAWAGAEALAVLALDAAAVFVAAASVPTPCAVPEVPPDCPAACVCVAVAGFGDEACCFVPMLPVVTLLLILSIMFTNWSSLPVASSIIFWRFAMRLSDRNVPLTAFAAS